MSKENSKKIMEIPVAGALGILAYGDLGLQAWRKVREEAKEKEAEKQKISRDKVNKNRAEENE